VHLPAGFSSADATPALLSHLPAAIHQGFVAGYAESIQTVFIVAVPIAALAFVATWLIPQIELRKWPSAESTPAAEPGTGQAPQPTTRQRIQKAPAARRAPGTHQAADSPDALDSRQT
jgi:hypothetical protein